MDKNFIKDASIFLAALLILIFLLQPFSARAVVVVDTVTVDVSPNVMTTLGSKVYVAGQSVGVSIIDTADNNSMTSVETGAGPADIIALGTKVYTANSGSNAVSVIDTANNNDVTSVSVGAQPSRLASLGAKVYVSNRDDGTVSVIDGNTDVVVDTIGVGGNPTVLAVVGSKVYVADERNGTGNSVTVINTSSGNSTSSIAVGVYPIGMAVLNGKIYVANASEPTVSVIDSNTDTVIDTLNILGNPNSVAAFGSKVYVETGDNSVLSIVNTSNSNSITNLALAGQVVFTTLGNRVYALKRGNGSSLVTVIDKNSDSVISTLTVNNNYNGKAIVTIGDKLYVANSDNTVSVIRTTDATFTAPASHYDFSSTIAISATADGVDGVRFYIDGTALGPEDTTDPYEASWDTTQWPDGNHTLYAVSRTNANEYATTTLSVGTRNSSAVATLYFYGATDNDWANINNWWLDAAHTQPSGLPNTTDNVIVLSDVDDNSGSPAYVRSLNVNAGEFSINATASAGATFNNDSIAQGAITGNAVFNNGSHNDGAITGNAIFRDQSINNGTVSGNATFNHSSFNHGTVSGTGTFNHYSYNATNAHVQGVATFNDGSYNSAYVDNSAIFNDGSQNDSGTVSGNATFNNDSMNDADISGSAIFNDSSLSTGGTITGNATFTGTAYPFDPTGSVIGGNITFTNNVVFTLNAFRNWNPASPATGWTFLGTRSWIFNDQANVDSPIPGDAIFNDYSTNNTTIQGNATFGCGVINYSTVLGVITNQSNCLYFTGLGSGEWSDLDNWWTDRDYSVHALVLPGPSDNIVVANGGVGTNIGVPASVASLLVYASQFNISATVSGGAAFVNSSSFDSASAGLTLNGDVRFMGASINRGAISGNASFGNTSSLEGSGSVTGNATFNGSSDNQSVNIGGSIVFNDSSKNTVGSLSGNPIFNDLSYNNSSISSGATFNDGSRNSSSGTVEGAATFNDYSYNQNIVGSGSVFNGASANNKVISGSATFNGSSYNFYGNGDIDGNAAFNDTSHNGAAVTGDATFACEATNSGEVSGTITYAVCADNSGGSGNNNSGGSLQDYSRTGGSTYLWPTRVVNSSDITLNVSGCPIGYICTKNATITPAPGITPGKTLKFLKNLKYKSKGDDVLRLQQFLKTQGFLKGALDGIFGSVTRSAVIKFQKAKTIKPATGSVGPITRGVINQIIK